MSFRDNGAYTLIVNQNSVDAYIVLFNTNQAIANRSV